MCGRLKTARLSGFQSIQCKVQFQYVYAGFTQYSKIPLLRGGVDQGDDSIPRKPSCCGDSGSLGQCVGGTDFRVESAAGGGDRVGRDGSGEVRVVFAEL